MILMKVYFIEHMLLKNLRNIVKEKIKGKFSKGDAVAIKTHMGEYGNLTYIRPPIVGLIVDELKNIGAEPFVFDTPTVYNGSRSSVEDYLETARKNGFTEETVGCPIVISDEGLAVKSKYLEGLEIAKRLYDADGMIVLSHFKGHEMSNFGGAIKNLGMGGVTKKSKGIMHSNTGPKIQGECVGCGKCIDICPVGALKLIDGKININYSSCFGCCACVEVCPNKVFGLKTVRFSRALSEAASFIVKKFGEKTLYINVLLDISEKCDCFPIGDSDVGKKVAPDIGIVVSDDIVAIEKASLDLVQEATDNKFGSIFKSKLDEQIVSAEEFNLGNQKYEIEKV